MLRGIVMWKISFTLFILLSSVISGMLFWQWNAYSEYLEPSTSSQEEKATQEISVESNGKGLKVTQVFQGLKSEKEYRIMVPEEISEWSCLKVDGDPCESVDENPSSFMADSNSIKITYNLDIKKDHTPILLNHWLGYLPDVKVTHTSIEVIDSTRRDGSWVVGLPLKVHNKFELIDYYYFEGEGERVSLYWQPNPLERINGTYGIQYYVSENEEKKIHSFDFLEKIPNFSGMSVILTESFFETNGSGLMIVNPSIANDVLERKIIYNYLKGKVKVTSLEESWLIDVLTSLITEQESKVSKGKEFIEELRRNLSEEEIALFLDLIYKESDLTPQKLDDLLGTVVGKNTRFFSLNKNEEMKLIPLYYYDSRMVRIQDKPQKELEVLIMENNERLIPFVETMSSLGFDVKALADNETLLLNKENNSYRFYVNQNIFIYNEEDYGLLENPLRHINGKVYVELSWLETIFKIDLIEEEEEIVISLDY